MSDAPALAIEASGVRKTFDRGSVTALDDLTLSVRPGEFVAITGPSGCGKTTFLHLLAALERPDGGTLRVQGQDVAHLAHPDRYRRQQVGLVFQMHNLLAHLDAMGNVGVAMLGTEPPRSERRERAREVLESVGLGHLSDRRPPQLSGGERQRLAIARALANGPSLLLADEPTGSLDSEATDQVVALLSALREDQDVTVVLVTHDAAVAGTADRVIHLRDGRVVDG